VVILLDSITRLARAPIRSPAIRQNDVRRLESNALQKPNAFRLGAQTSRAAGSLTINARADRTAAG